MSREISGPAASGEQCPRGVVAYAQTLLLDLDHFLRKIDDSFYRRPLDFLGGASVGAHVRHCVEHFTCFLDGQRRAEINYDLRDRDASLEQKRAVALHRIRELRHEIQLRCTENNLETTLVLRGCADATGESTFSIPSNVGRELLHVASHCLHHMAMVGMAARQLGHEIETHFGKAPATIVFEKTLPTSLADGLS